MSTNQFANQSEQTQALVELINKRAKLLTDAAANLAEIDQQISVVASQAGLSLNGAVAKLTSPAPAASKPAAAKSAAKRGPGRPKGSGKRGPGRPKAAGVAQPPLEEVIAGLIQRSKNGLELHELVTKALQSGYTTQSDNFKNMVEQALARLRKKEAITKDTNTMRYVVTEKVA